MGSGRAALELRRGGGTRPRCPGCAVPAWDEPEGEVPGGTELSPCPGCLQLAHGHFFPLQAGLELVLCVQCSSSCSLLTQKRFLRVLFCLVKSCCIFPPGLMRAGVGSVKGRAMGHGGHRERVGDRLPRCERRFEMLWVYRGVYVQPALRSGGKTGKNYDPQGWGRQV